jgi:hypothetical protein
MLLPNETFPLYPVQFALTNDRQMSCVVNMQVLLLTHFFVTLMIHVVSINIYIFLSFVYVVVYLLSPCFRRFIRAINPNIHLHSYAHEGKYFYGIILLIKEMLLVFVYVLFAFLYKWFGLAYNGGRITCMDLYRWLVEASYAPFLLCGILCGYYTGCFDMIFDEYQVFHLIGVTLKISLFFCMRYAESQPDLSLNHIETSLVSMFCQLIFKDNQIKE